MGEKPPHHLLCKISWAHPCLHSWSCFTQIKGSVNTEAIDVKNAFYVLRMYKNMFLCFFIHACFFLLQKHANLNCGLSQSHCTASVAYPEGRLRGSNPPIESSKFFVLRVYKIYSRNPALKFIKSKILCRKTLEIVR